MTGYPLLLQLRDRPVVVVGGGPVAARRVRGLLDADATVRVIAPALCEDLRDLAATGRIGWTARDYLPGDLAGAWLAHTATGSREADAAVAAEADAARIWCVRADDAAAATAWTPAVARVDGMVVAVGGGRDPLRARAIRDAVQVGLEAATLPVRRHRRTGTTGSVAIVGGGPGDPGLLTLRARRLLADADVVVVDRLAPRDVLAELPAEVEIIDVGKSRDRHPVPQEDINRILVDRATAGLRVVRLKGGDPFVFGRGGEELLACRQAGVPVEVVPGVTSAFAVPAAAGIPVTHRSVSDRVSVLTAHDGIADGDPGPAGTLVLLMGVSRLAASAEVLIGRGWPADTPVAIVESGTTPRQRTTTGTLATIGPHAVRRAVRSPAVIVVGAVAGWAVPSP